jgi:hypothetical protein
MEDKLHISFSNAASSLATFYKEIQAANDKSYHQGRLEATQELISWCEDLQAQGLKYIPIPAFLEMMQRYPSNIKLQEFPESRKRTREY